jgi:multiple sugar transport system ATP-binding protein
MLGEPAADAIPATIYTVEPTGDLTYAHCRIGDVNLVASVPSDVRIAADDKVWLAFDQEKLHLFDGRTQQALAAG